jgi:outer membrane protein assembly factor BamB
MNLRLTAIVAGLFVAAGLAPAADWPQFRGPHRDDISSETGLMKTFPEGGPRLAWTFEQAGIGYSGFSVVGNRLYSMGDEGQDEFVFALDTATGKEVWRQKIGPSFSNGFGGGPRCTPTVAGDSVCVLGPKGDLACLAAADGKVRWATNLVKDLKGKLQPPGWGYSESPLVDGDQVICTPGGNDGALAALDLATGKVRWRSAGLSAESGYASIVISEAGGVRHYVQLTRDGPAGFSPKDGKMLWHERVADFKTAAIPTPIVHGDYVYVNASYGAGCGMIKLTGDGSGGLKSEVVYTDPKLENHHGGVVRVGEHLYFSAGSAMGKTTLPFVCQDFKTGKVAWRQADTVEPSGVIFADGYIYCYGQKTGALVCVAANPTGFTEKGRFTIPKQTTKRSRAGGIWTHPVIADGKLYLRDQELLFCFDLRDGRASGD